MIGWEPFALLAWAAWQMHREMKPQPSRILGGQRVCKK